VFADTGAKVCTSEGVVVTWSVYLCVCKQRCTCTGEGAVVTWSGYLVDTTTPFNRLKADT